MTTEEALEVLYTINETYPKFNLTKRKAKILIPGLKKMDFKSVMQNLTEHVMHHLYPPTLGEIAAYEEEPVDSPLDEIKRWEEEAKKVAPEVKQHIQEQLEDLIRQKGWNR